MRKKMLAASGLLAITAASYLRTPKLPEVSPLPDDFRWGIALAGFQSEGHSPDSNWKRYSDSRAPMISDEVADAADWLNRVEEDVARAKDLGIGYFRYSVEWARTEPVIGTVDAEGFAFYDHVIETVEAAGLKPMITLDHWVYPGWLLDRGGWLGADVVDLWLAHAERVVRRYAGRGVTWITINEPGVYVDFEQQNRRFDRKQRDLMRRRLVEAHRGAYALIKELDPGAWATSNLAILPPPLHWADDRWFLDKTVDTMDFLGIDYYYGLSADNLTARHALDEQLWRIRMQPDSLLHQLRVYHRKVPHLPIWIIENGVCTDDGKPRFDGLTRSRHLQEHLYYLQFARDEGIPIIGYNYWSLTDNYEWGSYRPRFGLYTVDVTSDPDKERKPTDAVATYTAAIASHGVPPGFRPTSRPAWGVFAAPWRTTYGRLFGRRVTGE
ncbi:family 1 glycosylhydrolase [Yimella sp. cx-51]|uniref:family 1 glycosylhydrolase n=1 Tax=Yimella sp. cx-51 TaxID=2770551 RepID=UPI00165E5759|nr:family 1 glycosylhydrolase [Yimella sp. cx-51]MBC9955846.1 family 1 glycosylhydrolase [Yimella sp. cx-51]QTH37605.1 family 1 glycosylhydrolase [Yimella sp. cx-51]